MKRLIYTAASGWYTAYAPVFEYCCRRSYPDADVHVDIIDDRPEKYYAACYRLLNHPGGDYDEVYVTDVDMMHVPMSPGLWQYHEQRMAHSHLCYSNSPRKGEERGPERLTGLHFATPEWYQRTYDQRDHYLNLLEKGLIGKQRYDDELTLMKVCRESGVGIPPRERLIGRHFGIHLGTIRCYATHSDRARESQLRIRVTHDQAEAWNDIVDSDGFEDVARQACQGSRLVGEHLHRLEAFTRKWALTKRNAPKSRRYMLWVTQNSPRPVPLNRIHTAMNAKGGH